VRTVKLNDWIALIHVEIDGAGSVAKLRRRMYEYYVALRREYGLPVLPVALYLKVGMEGLGHDRYEEHFWELPALRFEYLYIGLPALKGDDYVGKRGPLGAALASLMKLPADRKVWLRAEAAKAVSKMRGPAGSEWKRLLLFEFIEAYWDLDGTQKREYDQLMRTEEFKGVRQMATTTYEKAVEKVRAEARAELLELLTVQLEQRFGTLSAASRKRFEAFSADRLRKLGTEILNAASLKELGL
jgi:hypothetical protein